MNWFTSLRISGKAYPDAEIFLLEKNQEAEALISTSAVISENGGFSILNAGFPTGRRTYALIIKDKDGNQTQTKVFNIDSSTDFIVEKNIFVPPTAEFTRAIVTRGDFIKVVGYASPENEVMVQVDNGIIYETESGKKGDYKILLNTAGLSFGRHSVRVKQKNAITGEESDFSPTRTFLVTSSIVAKADFNSDGKTDVKDWSIFLSFWNEGKQTADLNNDGNVDISDLSVFLRGFNL